MPFISIVHHQNKRVHLTALGCYKMHMAWKKSLARITFQKSLLLHLLLRQMFIQNFWSQSDTCKSVTNMFIVAPLPRTHACHTLSKANNRPEYLHSAQVSISHKPWNTNKRVETYWRVLKQTFGFKQFALNDCLQTGRNVKAFLGTCWATKDWVRETIVAS